MRTMYRTVSTFLLATLCIFSVAACGGATTPGGSGIPQTITIGTSLPLTGALASFGTLMQAGYMRAVNKTNAAGGIGIQGTKHKVQLTILDNKSDPNTASQQTRTLFLQDNVPVVLGAATPPLTIPMSNVGEQLKRPVVVSITPVEAWLGGRKGGWTYAWDAYFDENQQTNLEFQTSNLTKTNRRVALFTDTEEDGVVMGGLWEQKAPRFGYQIVYHAKFPVGTTNFSSQIAAAQAAKADVVIGIMITPDATALWKQMKSVGYQPKVAFCEKCGTTGAWGQVLGPVAEGTTGIDVWDPTEGFPEASDFMTEYGQKYVVMDITHVVVSYSTAEVVFDAIQRAQSLDPNAINAALGKTNKTYPMGHVQYGANHASAILALESQWQGGKTTRVYPPGAGVSTLRVPVAGLG